MKMRLCAAALAAAAALALAGCAADETEIEGTTVTTEDPTDAAPMDTIATPVENTAEEIGATPDPAATPGGDVSTGQAMPDAQAAPGQIPPADAAAGAMQTTPGGTQYTDVVAGTGAEATPGSTVAVHYTGTLPDGTKFDSSLDRGQPFTFNLGGGQVIAGWDEGVAGMKVGGKRNLVIPPDQGYGAAGSPPVIPPNSTLHFEVELLEVQ